MNRILFYSWLLSASILIYAFLPTTFSYGWDSQEKNQLYGNYLQSTGGSFSVIKETIDSELIEKSKKIYEINLTGNHPAKEYDFSKNYDFLISKFILKGKIIGKEKVDGLGEYYIFEVTDYKLGEYLPKIWSSSDEFLLYLFPTAIIIFLISSLGIIIFWIRQRKHNNS